MMDVNPEMIRMVFYAVVFGVVIGFGIWLNRSDDKK
jgi:hypothetical protein